MADSRAHPDISLPSSPRASISTAEQSATDFGAGQNSAITQRHPRLGNGESGAGSSDALVSQPAMGDATVTVQQTEPGSKLPQRTVTIRRTNSQNGQTTTVQDHDSNGSQQKTSEPEKSGNKQTDYTLLSMLRCWCLEIIALLLAAIVVVVIVMLLHYYHDRNVRSWNHTWAINSVSVPKHDANGAPDIT